MVVPPLKETSEEEVRRLRRPVRHSLAIAGKVFLISSSSGEDL
jgi:hypothetical protein